MTLLNSQLPPLENRESHFSDLYSKYFLPIYESAVKSQFKGVDGINIDVRVLKNPNEIGSIVLLPGRTESHLKYAETIFDLYHSGFSIFTFDARGQGHSGRMLSNSEIGYVEHYDDYVADLHTFMTTIVEPQQGHNLYFLAHSMGAAIGALYILKYQPPLRGVIFSSPLLHINLGNAPYPLIYAFIRAKCFLGLSKKFVQFPGNINVDTYGSDLTRSAARLTQYRSVLRIHPELRLGMPSNNWIRRSIEATAFLLKDRNLKNIKYPLLLLEAGDDSVLDVTANRSFEGFGSWMIKASFPGAFHDLFIERDDIRTKALRMMYLFMKETAAP